MAALLDPGITLLEAYKLMRFLQKAGESLRLRFVKGLNTPYAENLYYGLGKVIGC